MSDNMQICLPVAVSYYVDCLYIDSSLLMLSYSVVLLTVTLQCAERKGLAQFHQLFISGGKVLTIIVIHIYILTHTVLTIYVANLQYLQSYIVLQ